MSSGIANSFATIPGPKSFPIFGTLFHYLPFIGKYKFDELHRNGLKKYREFGSIVREEIVPGTNIVWIFTPEDIQELFRTEGRYPQRRSHLAIDHYRKSVRHLYNNGGLLPTNGPEWHRLRTTFQKGLSSLHNVRSYLPCVNEVVDDFVQYVAEKRRSNEDFLPQLSRAFLEILGLIAFDIRLNSFTEAELQPSSTTSRLLDAALTINSCILKTDNGLGMWRFWDTPLYNNLKRGHAYMESVAVDLVNNKLRRMAGKVENAEKSLLEMYLTTPEIDFKDVIGMSADMLLAGIDTITYSTSFALYHLATNKEKQTQMHNESLRLLADLRTPVTPEILARAEYLKAVLKESFRLNPVSVGIGRILTEDAIFSGYNVPKGTTVVTQNQVVCRLPEFFPDPLKFLPERWLKGFPEYQATNPHLVLPFGHGPRACIARRLAEQNMQILVLKLCRKFIIDWKGGVLDSKSYLINKPDGPLKFSFTARK
ncbi:hypothetical protein RUM44_005808 [Polyplax serrata]|uniref:Cytochrome P450 n=1 Tax=Polyplax serrata TaxID=468196 RepID=A0ABR1AY47_POLSC